ncbi:helix-turn-helix transcriptional regulator [Cytobacillus kochii]|uniref:helix-turn-helix domain-containing protein n=1 Tax=Cytobacillus kochii TaxID=859143 RepID=UPI002E21F2D5|nr:helix-turn-helix transcriptional regulator [Cytobacillus kochii]
MNLNEKIRAVRKAKNVNQSLIANALHISVQSYSMKETGKRPITTRELELIAQALEMPISNFFENEFNVKFNESTA